MDTMEPPSPPFSYDTSAAWSDITPLPQDDGPAPLAQIAYAADYSTAMSYLRAIMAKNELSQRALKLTAHIILMNPAHYTVWAYRFKCAVVVLGNPKKGTSGDEKVTFDNPDEEWSWRQELDWVHEIATMHEKNYQIWHFRQQIIDLLDNSDGERDATDEMFKLDSKNYHVWTYRQWLVRRFNLFDDEELEYTEQLIVKDVRNNSAWNHRFFVVFGVDEKGDQRTDALTNDVKQRELEFAKEYTAKAPQNPSPWNYMKGVLGRFKSPLSEVKEFCEQYAPLSDDTNIKSSHALDLLADIYDAEDELANAAKALDLLAQKYDPIRKNYWMYRKRLLRDAPAPNISTQKAEVTTSA